MSRKWTLLDSCAWKHLPRKPVLGRYKAWKSLWLSVIEDQQWWAAALAEAGVSQLDGGVGGTLLWIGKENRNRIIRKENRNRIIGKEMSAQGDSFPSFPHFPVFSLYLFPTLLPRSCLCFSELIWTHPMRQPARRWSTAGKESSLRHWINIPLLYSRFVTMNLLSFESICVLLLSQGMFEVAIFHQWFLSRVLPCLWSSSFWGMRAKWVPLEGLQINLWNNST